MQQPIPPPDPVDSLLKLIEEIAGAVECPTGRTEILARAGRWLMKALESLESGAHGSIWLAQFSRTPEVESPPSLICLHVFGSPGRRSLTQKFERGLMGWVATYRELVNTLVHDPSEMLSNGERVVDRYFSWGDPDTTEAELVVPMIYQGRLVGVLNLDRPAPERFPDALVLAARVLAAHTAQAIHQNEFDLLLKKLLGNTAIEELSETVVQFVGNFIEAPLACVYLWDMEKQRLRMRATNAKIADTQGKIIEPKQACYPAPGIGIVRWVFDHREYLTLSNLEAFDNPDHPDHESQKRNVRDQILTQRYNRDPIPTDWMVEETVEPAGTSGKDERRFWKVSVPGESQWTVAQPVRAHHYRFLGYTARSMLAVPILDTRGRGSALGVMFFERLEAKPFDRSHIALLRGVASYVGQAIAQLQMVEAQTKERDLIARVVTMPPSSWNKEFQNRLEERLGEMRDVMGADLLIVRQFDQRGLTLVACNPTEEQLRVAWEAPEIEIPREIPLGEGVSGHAARDRKSIFIPDGNGPERQLLDAPLLHRLKEKESAFNRMVGSEIAVPLMMGDTLLGTLMAVSRRPSSQAARRREGRWECQPEGLQEHHVHFLEHQARWLAPALAPIGEMVRRSRQLSSLSVVIRELMKLIVDRADLKLFQLATLVTATHHDGLGFHQAFLARCKPNFPGRNIWTISGKATAAWGSLYFEQQDHARRQRTTLDIDIQGALGDPSHCQAIAHAWEEYHVEVPYLPVAPCLILREGADAATVSRPGEVQLHPSRNFPGDPWWGLLDKFCELFSIPLESQAAREFQLGMVQLGKRPSYVEQEVIFVTNVGFAPERGETYIDPITLEMIAALDVLGALLALSKRVSGHDRLAKTLRQVRKKLAEIDLRPHDLQPDSVYKADGRE